MPDADEPEVSQPSKCETNGCHRAPDVRLFISLEEASGADRERWACRPCQAAMEFGNKVPGGNLTEIEVL